MTLATVSTFHDLPDAHVARALLEQHGIPTFLFDAGLGGQSWIYLPALRGMRLMVPASHLDEAHALLADQSRAVVAEDDELCPACGSNDVFRACSWLVALAALIFIGPPLLVRSRRRHCRACRNNWHGREGFLV